jgi:hypothetical protein
LTPAIAVLGAARQLGLDLRVQLRIEHTGPLGERPPAGAGETGPGEGLDAGELAGGRRPRTRHAAG